MKRVLIALALLAIVGMIVWATIGGGPAYKIIGGKVFTKGMRRK